jgi:hypothetical protein
MWVVKCMWYGDEYIYMYHCVIVCTWWILRATLGLIWRNSLVKVEEGKKNKNLNTRKCCKCQTMFINTNRIKSKVIKCQSSHTMYGTYCYLLNKKLCPCYNMGKIWTNLDILGYMLYWCPCVGCMSSSYKYSLCP